MILIFRDFDEKLVKGKKGPLFPSLLFRFSTYLGAVPESTALLYHGRRQESQGVQERPGEIRDTDGNAHRGPLWH